MKKLMYLAVAVVLVMGMTAAAQAATSSARSMTDAQMASIVGMSGCACGLGAAEPVSNECTSAAEACPCTWIGVSCLGCIGPYKSLCPGMSGLKCTGSQGDGNCVNIEAGPCQKFSTAPCSGCSYRVVYCTDCVLGTTTEVSCGTYKRTGTCP
jgi:hypothetical protein